MSATAPRPIRTIIVDDEPPARARLRLLLSEEGNVDLVGECANGMEAVSMIEALRPDLVFLDVQMPEVDGFEVLSQLDTDALPAVVFATAYDEFALKAFSANAIDYLLKPIEPERLRATLGRVIARGQSTASEREASFSQLQGFIRAGRGPRNRFAVRSDNRFEIICADELIWIGASNNNVVLHTRGGGEYSYRATMAEIMELLDPTVFLRIHRSSIINVNEVRYIEPWGLGEHRLVLADDTRLTASRRYRAAVRSAFGC